ncbi:MAG TPA: phospholipase D-like domain-containing protein [Vicinamibacterales bacterium]|nr:phospholipase D-like domain-containing protein [Vicinamibacterales bacterium]
MAAVLAWGAPAAAESLCDPAYQDCRTPLLNLINNETVGIDVAFWFMEDARYSAAIINRWHAGVPVRVIIDQRALPALGGTHPDEVQILQSLVNAGIPIRQRSLSDAGILHWKMMLFAGQNQLEFDGANYSPTAFIYEQPYTNYEWESIYFTEDPAVVNSFKTWYDNFWTDTTLYSDYANINAPLARIYPTYPKDPDLNFPQEESYANRILKKYAAETQAIDVIMFRITDERHTNAMIAAMQRGVPVRVISDTDEYRNTSRLWHAYNLDKLYAAGVPLRVRAGSGLNHQKLVILYGQQMAVFGSSNWTSPSDQLQQEHNYFTTKAWIYQWFTDQFNRKWNNLAPGGLAESQPFVPLPPDKPVYQSPVDGTVGALRSMELVWDGGPWGQKYDIYFGTDPNPPLLAADQQLGPNDPSAPSFQKWILPLLQPGTTYYWRVVSKTMAGLTAKGPIASFTTAGAPPPPPSPATNASTIVIWTSTDVAASNTVGNWQWLNDPTAAGGSALWNPDRGASRISPPLASPSSYFTTTFTAVAGVPYHLWVRLRAQANSTSNNSVSVQFSDAIDQYGSPLYPIGAAQGAEVVLSDPSGTLNNWGWADNSSSTSPATLIYFPSGTQTLLVQQRADGAIVDQIVLSPDAFLSTAPGGTLNDQTIYGSTIDGASPPPPPAPGPPAPPDVPAPWQHQDIGAVGLPGYATFDATSTFNVVAAGADIWSSADSFHYVYEPLSGDGTIVARVASLQNVNSKAKAGVMIRESLAPGATDAFMFVSTTKGVQFQSRTATGGATSATAGPIKAAPYWVRVDRSGNTFTGYYSADGATWTSLGTATIAMASNAFVGLAVTSHNTDVDTAAAIDHVSVNGVPVESCNATITPASQTFAAGGDTGSIAVSAANTCSWTATSNQSWLTVTSGGSGSGNGTVLLSAAPNAGASRTATVSVAGLSFVATQNAASCTYSISPAGQSLSASGGTATVTVTTGSWCTWSATSSDPTWLTVTGGASGTGSGSVTLSAAANNGPARSTTATIAGQPFTVSEPAAACTITLSPTAKSLGAAAQSFSVAVATPSFCSWTATSGDPSWLAITSGASGTGNGTVTFSATANAGAARSSTATIGGQAFVTSQAAAALPASWANQDVGAVGKTGSTTYDWPSSTFTIKGAGADVWGTADAFQYAYRPLSGDGVLIARVVGVSNTNAWVKAGVMIRETLDPGSAQAFMLVSFSKGTAFQRRTVAGGVSTNTTGPNVTAPYWVALQRTGNTINAYSSPDGTTWTLVGSDTFTMGPNVLVGLAVSSHTTTTLATATFDNVSVPTLPCSFSLTPSTQAFDASGGSATLTLTASDPSCGWTATSSDPSWLTVTSSASGSGNALVSVSAAANGAAARSATVVVGGQTFTATQAAAACSYAISPSNQLLAAGGGTATVSVTTGSWCSWTAASNDTTGWLTITGGASGTGNGTVSLGAAPNGGAARSATATIAGQTFTANQSGANCTFAITPASQTMANGGDTASIAVTTGSWCTWAANSSDPSWLTVAGPSAGTGSGTVTVNAAPNPAGARSATVTIGDQIFTASQNAAACSYAISPATQSAPTGGGAVTITLTTGGWCGWSASSDSSWLTITGGATGVGSGTITAAAAANGGAARTAIVTAAGLTSSVSQAAPLLPGGWGNQDIGAVGKAGSTSYAWATNLWTIKGAGADIWGTADAFQFAYKSMTGDGVVVARVASVSSTNAWVKAGVMIRETLDPGSTQALMLVSFSKGLAFQRRTATGGTSVSTAGAPAGAPYWVKLERIGNTFNAYSSPDGAAWTLVGSDTIAMGPTVSVGLAVSSHVSGALATATFDNVSTP